MRGSEGFDLDKVRRNMLGGCDERKPVAEGVGDLSWDLKMLRLYFAVEVAVVRHPGFRVDIFMVSFDEAHFKSCLSGRRFLLAGAKVSEV